MTVARGAVVNSEEGVYHCISRCVRQAYLCGSDKISGKCFNHRKVWVRERLEQLSRIFAIEVLGYALMSTHGHSMLRTRPDIARGMSDREVVKRWLMLFPTSDREQISILEMNKARVSVLRKRLVSVSWFMKSLNEFIARRANREDGCKGRFWEGRFKCQKLCDEAAILSCAVYIDLNPIRAKIADTPERSEFTSAFERIKALRISEKKNEEPDLWLTPLRDTQKRRGFLSISLPEYLEILDVTGREQKRGKRGNIPKDIHPILERIGINPKHWLATSRTCRHWFSHAIGSRKSLRRFAKNIGRSWVKGVRPASCVFA